MQKRNSFRVLRKSFLTGIILVASAMILMSQEVRFPNAGIPSGGGNHASGPVTVTR